MKDAASGTAMAALLVLAAACASGCGPLVGVKATVRVDEQTRLERQVLGRRTGVAPPTVLLSLEPAGEEISAEELRSMSRRYQELADRLADADGQDARTRAWHAVLLHNRAVILARLGRREGATGLLERALQESQARHLPMLEWQVLATAAGLKQGEKRQRTLAEAADALLAAPVLSELDRELEGRRGRRALYGQLIAAALEAGRTGDGLRYAAEAEAVELSRAVAPGDFSFDGGPLAEAAGELADARRRAADAREKLCALAPDELTAGAPAATAYRESDRRLAEARAQVRSLSAAGGLLVPQPADLTEVQSILPANGGLLLLHPTGTDRFAGFLLTRDSLIGRQLVLPANVLGEASAGHVLDGSAPEQALAAASEALLAPFREQLGGLRRLYLACPRELSGLAWQALPLEGQPVGERFEVAFLGGPGDLPWSFRARSYGRESLLVCGGWPGGLDRAREMLSERAGVSYFDVRERGRAELPPAAAFADVLWFLNPLELRAASPGAGYLAFPGELGRLNGVSLAGLAQYETRATAAGFAAVGREAFQGGSFDALRVATRALIAAGVPSAVYCTAPERVPEGGRAYWQAFLQRAREGSASAAHRLALSGIERRFWPAFRLYGYLGMDSAEYAEHSRLEFSDQARSASAEMEAGRFQRAAAHLLNLQHMAGSMEFGGEKRGARVLAQVQQQLVRCFRALGRYEEAVRHQRRLIERLGAYEEGEGPLTAVAHQSLGALLTEAERYQEATEAYRRCLELLREQDRREDMAQVLGELGKSLDRAAEYERALATFREALEQYRQLQKPAGVARQQQRIGTIYLKRLNNPPRAEEHFREARSLYERAGQEAEALGTAADLGLCRRALGDADGAMGLFQQVLNAAKEQGVAELEARALTEVANTRWLRGQYQQALELVGRSNEIARRLGDDFRLNVNYQLLGLIHWELNDYERALQALDSAVEAARRAQAPLEVASAQNNRGIVLRRRGDYEEALDSFGQALRIDERLRTRWGQGYDHRNIGITLHRMGRLEEASGHLERAVSLSREIGDRVNLAKALLALGELRADQEKPRKADSLLEEALAEARAVYLPEVEWRALHALGRLQEARGQPEAALKRMQEAIEVVEGLREALGVAELQSGFLANKMDLYEDAVRLLLDLGRSADAFLYAERSRARKFMDILTGQSFQLRTEREKELYAHRQELARRMRSIHETLAREQDPERRQELQAQLERLRGEYQDALVDLRIANPELSSFVTVEVASPAEVGEALPADSALVVYYLMEHELAIWVVSGDGLHVRRVPVERQKLGDRVRSYRLMIQNRELLDDVLAASRELHATLVEPVQDLLKEVGLVGVVPHGALHYLSFASLHDGETFLVEPHPLFYGPSASALRRTLSEPAAAHGRELEVLAVGNPAVGDPAFELPFTEHEVVSIRRDFVNVTPLTGERATEDWITANAGRFDVIHIGAHGRFDPANPLFSSLVLAAGKGDGLLHLHEVTGLELHARLVTLSACQSGLGELRSADELVSLSRAFAYAGTRAILSTLWRVDDVSTALVVKHFYRHFVDHRAARSLRHAQLQVMNDGRHRHPNYWAGVILTGDPR